MSLKQKIILIALLVVGGLCLIVGFTLMHYIGGFLGKVEEEARREAQEDEAKAAVKDESDAKQHDAQTGEEK